MLNTDVRNVVVVICFWTVMWYLYSLVLRQWLGVHVLGKTVIELPMWSKCYGVSTSRDPEYDVCEGANLDGFSLMHVLIYFTVGLVAPGYYGLVLGLSVACEVYEWWHGWRARWWQDPAMNLLGYWLGTMVSQTKGALKLRQMLTAKSKNDVVLGVVVVAALAALWVHCPSKMAFADGEKN